MRSSPTRLPFTFHETILIFTLMGAVYSLLRRRNCLSTQSWLAIAIGYSSLDEEDLLVDVGGECTLFGCSLDISEFCLDATLSPWKG